MRIVLADAVGNLAPDAPIAPGWHQPCTVSVGRTAQGELVILVRPDFDRPLEWSAALSDRRVDVLPEGN